MRSQVQKSDHAEQALFDIGCVQVQPELTVLSRTTYITSYPDGPIPTLKRHSMGGNRLDLS